MGRKWTNCVLTGVALAAGGLALSPAIGAGNGLLAARATNPVSLNALGSMSSFTPTTQDPRLAAAYAKAALTSSGRSFRFTPTSGSMSGRRSITVLVRAGDNIHVERTLPAIGIAPVAFNLDSARGWRKFALPDSVGRREIAPVALEPAKGFTLQAQKKTRFSTDVVVDTKAEAGSTPSSLLGDKSYTVDMASSYSLTKNLNVTAGVRYRGGPAARLAPLTDERQDNQAVYLGTIFKF
jgi:hypothetical protein